MRTQVEKPRENKSKAIANSVAQNKGDGKQRVGFEDNRKEILRQKAQQKMNKSILPNRGHADQCNCIGCSGVKQLITVKSIAKPNEIRNEGKIYQLTRADVYVNNSHRGGHDVGQFDNAVGGVDHAEQRAWGDATDNIETRFEAEEIDNVVVEFVVDQNICVNCQDWFETTAFNFLNNLSAENNNKPFELRVTVNDTTVRVLGQNETRWPANVGDEERWPLVDQLRHILIETGGLGDNQITVYDVDGNATNYNYFGDEHLEVVLRGHQAEIEQSLVNWRARMDEEAPSFGYMWNNDWER